MIDPGAILGPVVCPSTSQCTAVAIDKAGQELTFNPTAPGTPTPTHDRPRQRPARGGVPVGEPVHRRR